MPPAELVPIWLTAGRDRWLEHVRTWLSDLAPSLDLGAWVGLEPVKERPWAAVLRVQFQRGRCYLKAPGPLARHEAGLLAWLQALCPGVTPRLLAVEATQQWMLLQNGGTPLEAALPSGQRLDQLCATLAGYARVQRLSSENLRGLQALGLPDRRIDRVPDLMEQLLQGELLGLGCAGDEIVALRSAVRSLRSELEAHCRALGASGLPDALDHGDLNFGNILLGPGGATLCDWGDAGVAHPFCSLAMLPAWAAGEAHGKPDRLVDAYLAPWGAFGARESLLAWLESAVWVAQAARTLSWARMFSMGDAAAQRQWSPYLARALREFVALHSLLHTEAFWQHRPRT